MTLTREKCAHPKARVLYDQRPPSEGRALKGKALWCPECDPKCRNVLPYKPREKRRRA